MTRGPYTYNKIRLSGNKIFIHGGQHVAPWATYCFGNSQMVMINTGATTNPAIAGSFVGAKYYLPKFRTDRRTIVGIRVYSRDDLLALPAAGSTANFTFALLREFLLTLRQPDGSIIMNRIPITTFALSNAKQPVLDIRTLPDDRQSYIESVGAGKLGQIPIEFIYAP